MASRRSSAEGKKERCTLSLKEDAGVGEGARGPGKKVLLGPAAAFPGKEEGVLYVSGRQAGRKRKRGESHQKPRVLAERGSLKGSTLCDAKTSVKKAMKKKRYGGGGGVAFECEGLRGAISDMGRVLGSADEKKGPIRRGKEGDWGRGYERMPRESDSIRACLSIEGSYTSSRNKRKALAANRNRKRD